MKKEVYNDIGISVRKNLPLTLSPSIHTLSPSIQMAKQSDQVSVRIPSFFKILLGDFTEKIVSSLSLSLRFYFMFILGEMIVSYLEKVLALMGCLVSRVFFVWRVE